MAAMAGVERNASSVIARLDDPWPAARLLQDLLAGDRWAAGQPGIAARACCARSFRAVDPHWSAAYRRR